MSRSMRSPRTCPRTRRSIRRSKDGSRSDDRGDVVSENERVRRGDDGERVRHDAAQRLRVAIDAARTGGGILMGRWHRRDAGLMTKTTSTDVVLEADRAAETEVVRILRAAYPGDSIVAEEGSGGADRASEHRWYVDPLDGTVNYLYGIPHFAVAIGCEDATGMLAGVVYDPSRDELFTAVRGGGAWLRSERLAVRGPDTLGNSLVATGFAYSASARGEQARILNGVLPF